MTFDDKVGIGGNRWRGLGGDKRTDGGARTFRVLAGAEQLTGTTGQTRTGFEK